MKRINHDLENKIISPEDYTDYVGTLRSIVSQDEMRMILKNACLLKRGLGLGIELIGSGFFGNVQDIKENQHLAVDESLINLVKSVFIFDENKDELNKIIKNRKEKRELNKDKDKEYDSLLELLNYSVDTGGFIKIEQDSEIVKNNR